jgi:TctA family transporter
MEGKEKITVMDYVAAILLFGSALAGLFPFVHASSGMNPPQKPALLHTVLAFAGFIALVIFAFVTEKHHKHIETLIMLAIAGAIGIFVLVGNITERGKKGWLIAYSLTGMFGLWWLLTFIIKS